MIYGISIENSENIFYSALIQSWEILEIHFSGS